LPSNSILNRRFKEAEEEEEHMQEDRTKQPAKEETAEALEFTSTVSKGVTDATLTGAMIIETYQAKDGTYFVLVEYSLEQARRAAIDTARREEALWNEFKADQGFDDLERELRNLR